MTDKRATIEVIRQGRKYLAKCPYRGCRENRTMGTAHKAEQAVASHILAKHEDSSYLK